MTDSETPDPIREIVGGTSAAGESRTVPSAGDPSHPAAPVYASRREMRAAGGYAASSTAPAASAPAPAAPREAATRPARRPVRATRSRDAVRAALAQSDRPGLKRRVSTAGVMTVVFGIFASVTLPAFANQQEPLADTIGPQAAQTLQLSADSFTQTAAPRDAYSATSAADLRALYANALREQNLQAYLESGARELGDDYPWFAELTRGQGGGLSPLNYYYRECVDFVAWRLNRDAGTTSAPYRWVWSNLTPGGGSAYAWKRAWDAHGWPTGSEPQVGAVAWFPGGNHVAYVSGILGDGSVVIEEYNGAVDHGYAQRVIPAGSVIYLYAPPR